MEPLVSILIPAYNAERWIHSTLRSALSQTWRRKEVIVVDDGSTDNTHRIAHSFEGDSVKVVSQKNSGGGRARNRAYSLSQGDYIQWLDHDDLLSRDKITQQMERAITSGEHQLLSSRFSTFFECVNKARQVNNGMNQDLTPVDFFLKKFNNDA